MKTVTVKWDGIEWEVFTNEPQHFRKVRVLKKPGSMQFVEKSVAPMHGGGEAAGKRYTVQRVEWIDDDDEIRGRDDVGIPCIRMGGLAVGKKVIVYIVSSYGHREGGYGEVVNIE